MTEMEADLSAMGLVARDEQTLMAGWLRQDADEGRISLIEAPPATGKTLVMLQHALRLAERTGERVLLAVPTLSVMRQTMEAGRRLIAATGMETALAPIYGRQEYVNPDATGEWLAERLPETLPVLAAWCAEQDGAGWTRSSLDDAFREAGYDVDLGVETTLLSRRHQEAEAAYRRQYETTAQVLLCTHVLLARDVATRVGRRTDDLSDMPAMVLANERRLREETADDRILPEWRHLIVDEAHQLATGFMMALTSRLSFRRLLSILEVRLADGADILERPYALLKRMVDLFENGSDVRKGVRSRRLGMEGRHDRALVRAVEQCIPENPAALGGSEADTGYLRRFRDAAALAQRGRTRVAPSMTWSEIHHVLGLSVTPLSFGRQLDFLFRSCRSAALLSATLYSHDDDEPHDHLARQLMLPLDRVGLHPPIPSDWQTRDVTLHLPEGEMAQDLDPRRRDWTSSLAETIALAAVDSELGMLVLATSHADIAEVNELLDEDHGDRLVVTDERGVGPAARRFVEAARAGLRPIWLATGPAWTGLDLPEDSIDSLLVTRLPYGLSNPVMHEHLMGTVRTRLDFRDAETDMIKTLRQGIGRLVRDRDSRRPRFLWMADGRLDGERAGMRARSMLARYADQVAFGR
jgi:CRISPR type IV-associated DEAD/DEAH-box helicase Csf4